MSENPDDPMDVQDNPDAEPYVEPGAEGPVGTGVEGADDALLEDTDWDQGDREMFDDNAPEMPTELSMDETPAAEQGNRVGDEMAAEGLDDAEVAELSGDDANIEALADDGVEQVDVIDGMPEVIDDNY
ncbi:hypothetical protein DFO66_11381 [Brevibacterium sanguinis]|uniref:DUF5709 domain-containing protein n=2 Tax=Brevibacterium TaxID=1696 RepID=A0A366IE43_9MICO|nr:MULTISPECIES: hypothetical protein [Brevibacterium]RBP62815.1 hypothetical protein DFO66_11381 [Brevibacterium sanguinis]RBP69380.1 hypothetical protein DFO65_11381 [Brevibacterium celere]